AMLSPTTPPINDPGRNPTSANNTSPAPTPVYNPFFTIPSAFISLYLPLVLFAESIFTKALIMPTIIMCFFKVLSAILFCTHAKAAKPFLQGRKKTFDSLTLSHFDSPLSVISTEGRNLVLGTGSGRNLFHCRQLRFLGTLEMTGEGGFNKLRLLLSVT